MSVASGDHAGPWTVDDVLALPDDPRNRIELVGGALVMSPSPGVPHQRASRRLAGLLERAAEAAGAPVEILEALNVVTGDGLLIPDIVVADAAAAADAELTIDPRDVLAVIEIASPPTRVTDRKLKPALYAAAGIPSFWRVELEPSPRLYAGELHGGAYTETVVRAGLAARIERPFLVEVDPGTLLSRP